MYVSCLHEQVTDAYRIKLLRSSQAAPDDGEAERIAQQEHPHIHNDIACAMEICGPPTIFIAPEASKDLLLRFHKAEDSDLWFGFAERDPFDTTEVGGAMSIRRHQLALFKGAKTHKLPFGDPSNFDTLHCSPADQPGQPRMLIVSFVTPPGWGEMKIFQPPAPAPVDK